MRRTFGRAVAWAAIAAVTGCSVKGSVQTSATTGAGPAPDAATVQAVTQRLAADNSMAGSNVKVSLQGGSIALAGTVRSLEQKDRADRIVLQVESEKHQLQGVLDTLEVGTAPAGGPHGGR